MHKKAQTAVEFLTTYSWVLLLLLVIIILLAYSNIFRVSTWLPRQCMLTPGFQCSTYRLQLQNNSSGVQLIMQTSNGMGYDILFSGDAAALTADNLGAPGRNTYYGNCYPLGMPIRQGDNITCVLNIMNNESLPQMGENVYMNIILNYTNCNSVPGYQQTGYCNGGPNYTISGNIRTPIEPYAAFLYCGDGICSPSIGENALNCQIDCAAPFMSLTVLPTSVVANGSDTTQVIAYLTGPSGPVSGVDINFTTTLGNFTATGTNSTINTTNSSGVATAFLRSNFPPNANGTALVNASAILAPYVNVSNTTNVNFTNYPAYLNLALSPQIVLLGGSNTSVLTAQLLNENGDPEDPPQITFSSNSSTVKLNPPQNTTNASGVATSLASSSVAQVAQINVTYQNLLNSSLLNFTNAPPPGCNPPANGDWLIKSKILCKDVVIVLNGSLNVTNIGDLTFMNVTLRMNVTNPSSQGIFVQGGNFTILNHTSNPSNITNNTPAANGYLFQVSPGSIFVMMNSELHYCGFSASGITNNKGLYLNTNGFVIANNTFSYNNGGIILYSAQYGQISNNTFYYNNFSSTSDANIEIYASSSAITINNNSVINTPGSSGSGIYLFDAVSSINITNNKVSIGTGSGIAVTQGLFNTNNNVINNTVSTTSGRGILVSTSNNNIISNTVSSAIGTGIELDGPSNNVTNNTAISSRYGVYLMGVTNENILNNKILNSNQYGIWIRSSGGNNFTNNTISNNAGNGIYSTGSSGNIFTNNTISNNTGDGIHLESISCNNFINNNIVLNNTEGIYIQSIFGSPDKNCNNSINNSKISNNHDAGVYLSSSGNNVTNSIISNNTNEGIYVGDINEGGFYLPASNNKIYNNLLNNTNDTTFQTLVAVGSNLWNTTNQTGIRIYSLGTNIGGNYWTNPSGTGYSDTCPDTNFDGFCDVPWDVLNNVSCSSGCSGNTDFLPLSNIYMLPGACVAPAGQPPCSPSRGSPPPNGDWNVSTSVVCQNRIITLNGNLNILNGGDLTLKNVTLKMNIYDPGDITRKEAGIFVQSGGKLTILDQDNNPATTNDASNVTICSGAKLFDFVANPSSTIVIKNSQIQNIGWDPKAFFSVGAANIQVPAKRTSFYLNTNGAVIVNNTFSKIYGLNLVASNSSQIINNSFYPNNDTAIYLISSYFNTISNNYIDSGYSRYMYYTTAAYSTYYGMDLNLVGNAYIAAGIYLGNSPSNNITGNTVVNGPTDIPQNPVENTVNCSTMLNCFANSIYLWNSANSNITGNTILRAGYDSTLPPCADPGSSTFDCGDGSGIYLSSSNSVLISNNYISDSSRCAIDIRNSNFTKVTSNYAGKSRGCGIYAGRDNPSLLGVTKLHLNSNNTLISNNNVSNSDENGIVLDYSTYTNTTFNIISFNSINAANGGIALTAFTSYNKFFNNTIFNNTGYGISFVSSLSPNNNVTNNTIVNNTNYGVHCGLVMPSFSNNNITNNGNNCGGCTGCPG